LVAPLVVLTPLVCPARMRRALAVAASTIKSPVLMRVETFPVILGILLGLLGVTLLFDAWTVDEIIIKRERRRRPRLERHRGGEAAIGLGIMCMGAAFVGRDTWSYSIVAVIAGSVLLLYGTLRNRAFLGSMISNRGPLRRRPP